MTYEERIKFYEKVGNAVTEVFKKKFPNLCKITIYEGKPVVLRDMEFLHDVKLFVYTIRGDRETDLYEIDKFVQDYFGIKTNERHRVWKDGCSQ